jgi:curved DNA-binding protein CbpA
MTGNLKTRPFALLLTDLDKAARSGVLTLVHSEAKRQICVIRGRIRLVASNVRGEQFSEFLRREGSLPPEIMERIDQGAATCRPEAVLLVSQAVTSDQLKELVRRHAMSLLMLCREWTDGTFAFVEGVPGIEGAVQVDICPIEVILESARREPDQKLLSRLAANPDGRLRPATERNLAADVMLTPAERAVVTRVGTGVDIGALLALAEKGSDLTRELVLAASCALVQSGLFLREKAILTAREPSERVPDADASTILTDFVPGDAQRYIELLGRMEGLDHYQMLGVPVTSPEKEIRRAYYALAKQLHPDRFTSPEMLPIKPQMEALFGRITEAYNTLTDTFARREYDVGRGGVGTVAQAPVAEAAKSPVELARANYVRGKQLFEEGKHVRALTFLKNAVDLDASRPEHLFWYGKAIGRSPRQRQEAMGYMMRAVGLDPTRPEFQLEIGRLHLANGEPVAAEQAFRSVLRWSPKNQAAKQALEELTASAKGGVLGGLFGARKK